MKERLAEIFGAYILRNIVQIIVSFIGAVLLLLLFPQLIERLPFGQTISGFILLATFMLVIYLFLVFVRWIWQTYLGFQEDKAEDKALHSEKMHSMRDLIENIANSDRDAYSIVLWLVQNNNEPLKTYRNAVAGYYFCESILYKTQNHDGTFTYQLTDEGYRYLDACYQENGLLGHLPRDISPAKTAEEQKQEWESRDGDSSRMEELHKRRL